MADTIRIKRGSGNVPTLQYGEFAYSKDKKELYIGAVGGNERLCGAEDVADINNLKDTTNGLQSLMTDIINEINTLYEHIRLINGEIANIKTNINTANGEIANIKTNINTANGEIANMKVDINTINSNITRINGDIAIITARLNALETPSE